jgi:hypothetical protein
MRRIIVLAAIVVAGLGVGFLSHRAIKAQSGPARAYWTLEHRISIVTPSEGTVEEAHEVTAHIPNQVSSVTVLPDGKFGFSSHWTKGSVTYADHRYGVKSSLARPAGSFLKNANREIPEKCVSDRTVEQMQKNGMSATYLGEAAFLGTKVHRWRFENSLETVEVWKAPELACYDVRTQAINYKDDGSVNTVYEDVGTNLSFEVPDESIITVPANYVDGPPSDLYRRWAADGIVPEKALSSTGAKQLEGNWSTGAPPRSCGQAK